MLQEQQMLQASQDAGRIEMEDQGAQKLAIIGRNGRIGSQDGKGKQGKLGKQGKKIQKEPKAMPGAKPEQIPGTSATGLSAVKAALPESDAVLNEDHQPAEVNGKVIKTLPGSAGVRGKQLSLGGMSRSKTSREQKAGNPISLTTDAIAAIVLARDGEAAPRVCKMPGRWKPMKLMRLLPRQKRI